MIKLLIIADDFTGALDAGVHFSKCGVSTLVTLDKEQDFSSVDDAIEVISIDAETRHIQPGEAYSIVFNIAQRACSAGIKYIYKKVDSTLRGNIGSEISAVMDATRNQIFYFAPAFPQNMRTTLNGKQYVNGQLISETDFSKDPFNPVQTSDITEIIHEQADLNVIKISTDKRTAAVSKTYVDRTVFVFDAVTIEDLSAAGCTLPMDRKCVTLGGSAGFASILNEFICFHKNKPNFDMISGSPLFIVGSVNQISLDQVAYAKISGYPSIYLTVEQKMNDHYYENKESEELIDIISNHLKSEEVCIISTVSSLDQLALADQYAEKLNIKADEIAGRIMSNIGRLVEKLLINSVTATLVVFGGDTLLGIADHIGCKDIIPIDEIAPGIVLSYATCSDRKMLLVTKAGGFGSTDIITKINKYLKQYYAKQKTEI